MLLATAIFSASELLTDTVILDLVDDVIDRHEGLVADVHPHIGNRRHEINTSIPRRSKPFHSRRDLHQTPIFRATLRRIALRKRSECLFGQRGRTLCSRE